MPLPGPFLHLRRPDVRGDDREDDRALQEEPHELVLANSDQRLPLNRHPVGEMPSYLQIIVRSILSWSWYYAVQDRRRKG